MTARKARGHIAEVSPFLAHPVGVRRQQAVLRSKEERSLLHRHDSGMGRQKGWPTLFEYRCRSKARDFVSTIPLISSLPLFHNLLERRNLTMPRTWPSNADLSRLESSIQTASQKSEGFTKLDRCLCRLDSHTAHSG